LFHFKFYIVILIFDIYIFNLKHGIKKETLCENGLSCVQRDKLPQAQVKNNGRQAGIVQVLQHLPRAHQAQRNEKIKTIFFRGLGPLIFLMAFKCKNRR